MTNEQQIQNIRYSKEQIETEIARLEAEKEKLAVAEEKLGDPVIRLAIVLHDKLCHNNHTDMCGWFYENDSEFKKPGSARNRYYIRAKKFLENEDADIETILRLLKKT